MKRLAIIATVMFVSAFSSSLLAFEEKVSFINNTKYDITVVGQATTCSGSYNTQLTSASHVCGTCRVGPGQSSGDCTIRFGGGTSNRHVSIATKLEPEMLRTYQGSKGNAEVIKRWDSTFVGKTAVFSQKRGLNYLDSSGKTDIYFQDHKNCDVKLPIGVNRKATVTWSGDIRVDADWQAANPGHPDNPIYFLSGVCQVSVKNSRH